MVCFGFFFAFGGDSSENIEMKLLKPKTCNGEKSESIAEEHEGNQKVQYKSSCDEDT